MEEIWRDVAPGTESSPQQPERVLDTGEIRRLVTLGILVTAVSLLERLLLYIQEL